MGCGSSAKPKYEGQTASADATTIPDEPKPINKPADAKPEAKQTGTKPAADAKAEGDGSLSLPAVERSEKRRPSLSREAEETAPQHEGHELGKESNPGTPVTASPSIRPSQGQLHLEMLVMDAIPEIYGVDDSDELRKSLQEDAQAEKVSEIVQKPSAAEGILRTWLDDAKNEEARDEFIKKALAELENMEAAAKKKASKQVLFKDSAEGAGQGGASNSGPERSAKRKGTGFITSNQVRALMAADIESEEEDEEEEESDAEAKDDEAFEREVQANLNKHHGERIAVSSEAYSVPEDWKPPVYEKTPDQRKRIKEAVSDSFMFAALSPEQLNPVIDAFQEYVIEAGVTVIEEGAEVGPDDKGLFVLESGEMDVYKKGREEAVFTYTVMGQFFGDLALLYNAPRAATVVSTKPSVLWWIDRNTFNCLVKNSVREAKERRMEFLKSVDALSTLNVEEVSKIGDALRAGTYGAGVHIIQEGAEGNVFFILERGSAAAFKEGEKVQEYKPGDYFGELALIKSAPRAADVVTSEDCTVLSLERKAFDRLLGPLSNILEERAASYK